MIVLVSVTTERARAEREGLVGAEGRRGSVNALPEEQIAQGGGRILALDERGRLRGQLTLPSPAGMAWPEVTGPISVLSRRGDALLRLDPRSGAELGRVEHPWINDPHTLWPSAQGLLLTSTGLDLLLELDGKGEPRWSWWAQDHGLEAPSGRRDPGASWRGVRVPTLERALHLSCAVEDGERLLATSFHTGEILEIRRSGKLKVLRGGLEHPTCIAPNPLGGWIVCEGAAGRVKSLRGPRLEDEEELAEGLRWVQAAAMAEGRLWVLDNPVHGPRAEGGSRVMMVDPISGKMDLVRQLSPEWKLQSLLPLDGLRSARLGWIRPG